MSIKKYKALVEIIDDDLNGDLEHLSLDEVKEELESTLVLGISYKVLKLDEIRIKNVSPK